MSTDILLATLIEYINSKQEFSAGQAEAADVQEAKKRFGIALNDYVDWRIKGVLEKRRSHLSQEMVAVADTINSTVKSSAISVKAMAALNSAPPPPPDSSDPEVVKQWYETYREWYNKTRQKGMSIG